LRGLWGELPGMGGKGGSALPPLVFFI